MGLLKIAKLGAIVKFVKLYSASAPPERLVQPLSKYCDIMSIIKYLSIITGNCQRSVGHYDVFSIVPYHFLGLEEK